MATNLEVVANDNNLCGEAPIWDPRQSRLLWVDNESALVYQMGPAEGERSVISERLQVNGIALNEDGRRVFAGSGGLHLWRGQDDYRTMLVSYEDQPLQFNDILAVPGGRLLAGTLYWGAAGMEQTGKLYCIDPDLSLRIVDEGIELSNGLALSPDDRTLYYADSAARRIYTYDFNSATGTVLNRRLLVQVPTEEGIPDGLTVDSAGFIWCAQWYGAQVVRYDPDGQVERRIPMPVKQVSSLAFGGPDLSDLYITTAGAAWPSRLMPPGYDPNGPDVGGALYHLRLDIAGKPEHRTHFR